MFSSIPTVNQTCTGIQEQSCSDQVSLQEAIQPCTLNQNQLGTNKNLGNSRGNFYKLRQDGNNQSCGDNCGRGSNRGRNCGRNCGRDRNQTPGRNCNQSGRGRAGNRGRGRGGSRGSGNKVSLSRGKSKGAGNVTAAHGATGDEQPEQSQKS